MIINTHRTVIRAYWSTKKAKWRTVFNFLSFFSFVFPFEPRLFSEIPVSETSATLDSATTAAADAEEVEAAADSSTAPIEDAADSAASPRKPEIAASTGSAVAK